LGISFAEYVRRVITDDLSGREPKSTIGELAGIGNSGASDVATNKDDYLVEALDR
jgi:hypothetical protein